MAVTTRAVRAQAPSTASGTETQDFTVTGFGTPSACYVYVSNGGSADADADNLYVGHGFYDGTRQRCIGSTSFHGIAAATTTRCARTIRDTHVVYLRDSGTTTERTASAEFITDGVRLTWNTGTVIRPFVTVVLIKGATAYVGTGTPVAATPNYDATFTASGTPDLVLIASNGGTSLNANSQNVTSQIGVAWNDGGAAPYPQYSLFQYEVSGQASTQCAAHYLNDAVGAYFNGIVRTADYTVTAWGTDQFTLTSSTDHTVRSLIYLALATGGTAAAFNIATPTGAGDWSPTLTDATPHSVLAWTTALTSAGTNATSGDESAGSGFYYVNADGDALGHYGVSEDATGDTNSNSSGRISAKLIIQPEAAGTPIFDATSPTFTGTGWTVTDANMTQGASAYLIFGIAFDVGTALYLKLLAHSSAASATGVEGWVVDADNTTYYGKFTGGAFLDSDNLESGQAVLKVACTEFGGEALTTSDTPQVVIRNTTYGTTMCDATVIEE